MHQPSLLALGAPSISATVPLDRTMLDDTSWFDRAHGWLCGADELYEQLAEHLPWRHSRRWMYDRMVDDPRLSCGIRPTAPSTPPIIGEIADALTRRYGERFDSVFCNWYRDGRDSVAWHGDRLGRTRADPLVAIVSLGGPRRFRLRPTSGGRSHRLVLHSGDLLVMGGRCQRDWEHSVPKSVGASSRISVTLRHGAAGDRRASAR